MSIFTTRPQPSEMMPSKALLPFCIAVADNVKIKTYAFFDPNIPYGSRVMSISTNWP